MSKGFKVIVLILICGSSMNAQVGQDTSWNWEFSGYIKSLQNYYDFEQFQKPIYNGLLHNRINFTADAPNNFKFHLGLRNRMFIDPATEGFAQQVVGRYKGTVDLSETLLNKNGLLWYANIDRLYFAYQGKKWEVRLGRQRINWGIAEFWNPNDLFNAYNFTDFDYEERPGSDAAFVQYSPGFSESYSLAYRIDTTWESSTIATRLWYNINTYDIQFIAGKYNEDIALGGGWAGAIGGAGFKGEFMNFIPTTDGTDYAFSMTMMSDYVWGSGLYTSVGAFFNSAADPNSSLQSLYSTQLSARNLYPYMYTTAITANYPINPILSTGISVIYSIDKTSPLFISPSFTWNIANNWDMNILGQWFFNDDNSSYGSRLTGVFLRFKWSY